MKKTIAIATFSTLLVISGAAIAQAPGDEAAPGPAPAPASGRPYGDAGCGLGSVLFGGGTGLSQVLASTTNGSTYTQLFGITSGTSNCVDFAPGPVGARSFSQTNRTVLAKDISRGRGETIATLSALGGCKDAAVVGASLQKNYRRIVPSAEVTDRAFAENVVHVLATDSSLTCKKLGSVAAR